MEIRSLSAKGRVPVTVLQIVGDVDTHTYEQLEAQAKQAHADGATDIVLDLAEVGYVSSAGIRAINVLYRLLQTGAPEESDEAAREGIRAGTFKSRHLKLANLNRRVSDALKIAGVDMFLELHPSLASAIESF
ncbi:MAG TPA: STAS domain-containing protein [Chloroflexia bacterium]|nr:STAS domain-containing protein [Chloroflexia bacterium]